MYFVPFGERNCFSFRGRLLWSKQSGVYFLMVYAFQLRIELRKASMGGIPVPGLIVLLMRSKGLEIGSDIR